MSLAEIEQQCELGQHLLMEMEYLKAERVLAGAEAQAWAGQAWDVLSRLYLPLQEARRQRRQRCGEGTVCLDLAARFPEEIVHPEAIVDRISHGQLLVAGWGTVQPAVAVRETAEKEELYLETFLAAVYPAGNERVIAIVPRAGDRLPAATSRTLADLRGVLPEDSLILSPAELPVGKANGSAQTYAQTMALWERLHTPFLARAERAGDPMEKMRLFRQTIIVDYGCEFAHQHLADVARQLRRHNGSPT
jgi:hypothetical protein